MGRGDTGTLYASAKLNARGQITIPVRIRKRMGLKPHDQVVFVIGAGGDKVELVALPRHSALAAVGMLTFDRPYASMDDIRREAGVELAKTYGLSPED